MNSSVESFIHSLNSFVSSIDSQALLLLAAIVVTVLFLRLIFRIITLESGTIIAIVAILVILNYVFQISPMQLWFEIGHLPQDIKDLINTLG